MSEIACSRHLSIPVLPFSSMQDWFAVHGLDVERLLVDWRWLCKGPMVLPARNAFGDLFLRDETGHIHQLDVAIAKLTKVADSEAQFREPALSIESQEEWLRAQMKRRRLREDWNQITISASDLASISFLPKAALLIQLTLLTSTNTSPFSET